MTRPGNFEGGTFSVGLFVKLVKLFRPSSLSFTIAANSSLVAIAGWLD